MSDTCTFTADPLTPSFRVIDWLPSPRQIATSNSRTLSTTALAFTTRSFGWFYLWVVFGVVIFCLCLAFSRYGNLRLGKEDEEPEFSGAAWFAMPFAAGIGLVFWGAAEPLLHYQKAMLEHWGRELRHGVPL